VPELQQREFATEMADAERWIKTDQKCDTDQHPIIRDLSENIARSLGSGKLRCNQSSNYGIGRQNGGRQSRPLIRAFLYVSGRNHGFRNAVSAPGSFV
jgi:hypothetical protein